MKQNYYDVCGQSCLPAMAAGFTYLDVPTATLPNGKAYVFTGQGWVIRDWRDPGPAPTPAVQSTVVSWTHLDFRDRFTQAEKQDLDELEVTFESLSALSAAQKKALRTGYKDFNAATVIMSNDPKIPAMLGLFVALGKLAANRPAEILTP